MRTRDIVALVNGTSDAAFAVDGSGHIVAWNSAAEATFGRSAAEVVGGACSEIIKGTDECGPVCSRECCVRQAIRNHHPVRNFDLQVQTAAGRRWCNASVLMVDDS